MKITFVTDLGEVFPVEIDPNMELESVMALLQAEVRVQFPKYVIKRVVCHYIFFTVWDTHQ
jgi:hypothetical protein